jgi:serine/threonine-protein kinase CLA4
MSESPERPSIVVDTLTTSDPSPSPLSSAPNSRSPSPTSSAAPSRSPSPSSPRYSGWVSEVLAPLKPFIDAKSDPQELFADLQEIAEGESGSVYAARVVAPSSADPTSVAIKQVALVFEGSPKLESLAKELELTKKVYHENILTMNMLYVDVVDDSLWIRMELMDRSLADVLNLAENGVIMTEVHIAQVACDVRDSC